MHLPPPKRQGFQLQRNQAEAPAKKNQPLTESTI